MEYVMLHGAEVDVDKARQFEELFRKHAQITELSKVSPTILTRHKIRFLLCKYLSIYLSFYTSIFVDSIYHYLYLSINNLMPRTQ